MSQSEDNVVVLVADDEPSTLAMVASRVRSKGYKVFEASDGDLAWQLAHEHLPDLVVLDVMMPGMSGWEVCRKIREAVSLAHTGVIMLTGIGENLNEMTSPLYGADSYLDKPFDFDELDKRILSVLQQRRGGAMGRPAAEAPRRRTTASTGTNGSNGAASAPALAKALAKRRPRATPPSEAVKVVVPKSAQPPAKKKPAKAATKKAAAPIKKAAPPATKKNAVVAKTKKAPVAKKAVAKAAPAPKKKVAANKAVAKTAPAAKKKVVAKKTMTKAPPKPAPKAAAKAPTKAPAKKKPAPARNAVV